MPTYEDFQEIRRQANEKRVAALRERELLDDAAKQAAQELLADPKWKVYSDLLKQSVEIWDKKQSSIIDRLTDPFKPPTRDEYLKHTAELAFTKGYIKALRDAVESVEHAANA